MKMSTWRENTWSKTFLWIHFTRTSWQILRKRCNYGNKNWRTSWVITLILIWRQKTSSSSQNSIMRNNRNMRLRSSWSIWTSTQAALRVLSLRTIWNSTLSTLIRECHNSSRPNSQARPPNKMTRYKSETQTTWKATGSDSPKKGTTHQFFQSTEPSSLHFKRTTPRNTRLEDSNNNICSRSTRKFQNCQN